MKRDQRLILVFALVLAARAFASECDDWRAAHPDWIWCDDFETNRLASYFEYDNAGGRLTRTASVGINGSTGMKVIFPSGMVGAGSLHLAFGRTPSSYFRPVDAGTNDYRELYWRVYLRRQAGWSGGGADKLSRAIILANANWAEAAFGHVWSGGTGNNYLVLAPASGTDPAGNLKTTHYNDFPNMRWLGYAPSVTPIFDSAHAGAWYCIEAHMKLNDAGAANGWFELWTNGQLEARKTNLNWVGSYNAYGINAVFLENYWNAGSPATQERYFDNFVVSTKPIGPVGGTSTPPVITNFALDGTNCVISFATVPGRNYDGQRANDLTSGVWSTVATNIPGTGGTIQITDTNATGQPKRFYRVRTSR